MQEINSAKLTWFVSHVPLLTTLFGLTSWLSDGYPAWFDYQTHMFYFHVFDCLMHLLLASADMVMDIQCGLILHKMTTRWSGEGCVPLYVSKWPNILVHMAKYILRGFASFQINGLNLNHTLSAIIDALNWQIHMEWQLIVWNTKTWEGKPKIEHILGCWRGTATRAVFTKWEMRKK